MVNSTFTGTRSPGFGDNQNLFANSMVTYGDYVYIANYNDTTGTEIWRSNNGTEWAQVNTNNFGDAATTSFAALSVFNGSLYAINSLNTDNHVDIYRYSSGTSWSTVATIGNGNTRRNTPLSTAVYNNSLYVSLYNANADVSAVYSSADGENWDVAGAASGGDTGFGDNNNQLIFSMATYNNRLYASTSNDATGTEIWYFNGSSWTQSNSDGFDGTVDNYGTGSLTNFNGALYASTMNTTTGAEVWRTTGTDWELVSNAGFGDVATNNTFGSAVFKDKLYIGFINTSAKVYRTSDGTSWEQVNTNGFGYEDNDITVFSVLGDYLYTATGLITIIRGVGGPNTTEVYRYYEPSAVALPQTGAK